MELICGTVSAANHKLAGVVFPCSDLLKCYFLAFKCVKFAIDTTDITNSFIP